MLGMGVVWCGLIGPWSEGEKEMHFSNSTPQRAWKRTKSFQVLLLVCIFFPSPCCLLLQGEVGAAATPSGGACHIVLLQFYISIKAM